MSEYALALSEAELGRYRFMAAVAAEREAAQWTAAGIVPGAAVADVGCGPGAVSAVLAGLVGPTGRVVAVDRDAGARAAAEQALADHPSSRVVAGDADATGLEPASLDVVMMRHVLAHNGGREQTIVDHLASLVRPAGSVYLVDVEFTGARTYPSDQLPAVQALTAAYLDYQTSRGNDLSVGLRLGALLREAGCEQVVHTGSYTVLQPFPGMRPPAWAAREQVLAAGLTTQDQLAPCEAEFPRLDAGELTQTWFIPQFSAFGFRPA